MIASGLARAAPALGAPGLRLSVGEADVQRIAQCAQSDFKATLYQDYVTGPLVDPVLRVLS